MNKKIVFKLFSLVSAFSILFNLFYTPLYVLAQETGSQTDQSTPAPTLAVETNPTPEVTFTPEPNQTPEATSTPESTPTPEEVSTPTATPTSEPTIEPTPTLLPGPEVVLGEKTESSSSPTNLPTSFDTSDSDKVFESSAQLFLTDASVEKECLADQNVIDSQDVDWYISTDSGYAQTKSNVQIGVRYVFPLENKVTLTFKCLPKDESLRSSLKIQKVKVSDLNLPEGLNPYGEWAYDITTGMKDGTFEYDITLPKPENQEAKVFYMEDVSGEVKNVEDEKINQEGDKIRVESLDHFSVFYLVTVSPGGVNSLEKFDSLSDWITSNSSVASGSGDDSPLDGNFAKIDAGGYICRDVDALGFQNLLLQFYWKGDKDAGSHDNGYVYVKKGGNCSDDDGWTKVYKADLDTNRDKNGYPQWSSQISINLNSSFSNSNFKIKFKNSSNDASDEFFRVDNFKITGTKINWPDDWTVPSCYLDPTGESGVGNTRVDLDGTSTSKPAASYKWTNDYLYLRFRVDGNPGTASNPDNFAWSVLVQNTPPKYQYLITLDGLNNQLKILENNQSTASNVTWNPILNDPAETLLWSGPSSMYANIVHDSSTVDDHYIILAVPISALPSSVTSSSIFYFATAADINNFNKDHLNCYEQPQTGLIRVEKSVKEGNTWTNQAESISLFKWRVDDETQWRDMGTSVELSAGSHSITENSVIGYQFDGWYYAGSGNGSCISPEGTILPINLNIVAGQQKEIVLCNSRLPYCGDGIKNGEEQCDGTDGVTPGQNFCTKSCTLVPIYDGEDSCPAGTVKSQTPILSKVISATDPDGETFNLDIGGKYIFEVSGTYSYDKNNSGKLADAAYGTKDNWSSTRTDIGIWGTNRGVTSLLADLGSGVGVVEWDNNQMFNPDHTYQKYYSPTKNSVQFLISDWYDNWFNSSYNNQSAMSDNSGSLTLNVYKCEPVSEVKICKYDNNQQPLSGWRVYLLGEKLNSFSIPSDGSVVNAGNYSSGSYALIASGVYNYGDPRMNADAANSYRYVGLPCAGSTDGWVNGEASSCMSNYLSLNLSTSGGPTAPGWGLYYNPEHIYAKAFTGGNLQAKIWDTCSLSQPEGCYGDNEGKLKLDVYKGYVGDTGNDGCVTFNNVPYGSYQLDEVLKEGWRKESGQGEVVVDGSSEVFSLINALNYGSISGKKYDGSEEGTVLSGWSIVLTGNSHVSSLNVPANGEVVNSAPLESGKKYLVKVSGAAQAGDNIHFDAECASDGGVTPWINGVPRYLSYGENLLDLKINDNFVDWGSCEPVNHTYYYLLNGNGSPVSFKVYDIYYPNNTGSLTVEIYEVVKEDVTDSTGYGWNDVLAGDYQLCEIIQTGWNQTKPGTFGAPTCYSVKVTPGSNQTFDFVNFKLGTIQGRKYEDLNGNGSENSGEPYLNGWTIRLYKEGEGWDLVDSKTTGHTGVLGEYKFENLEPGRYRVCEVLKDGWVQTSPTGVTNNIASDEAPSCRVVNINTSAQILTDENFGNFKLGRIYGYKYDEDGETGIGGWKIFIDNDGDKSFDEGEVSVQTGNDGYFEFTGLTSGTYNVCEVEQSGWQRMYPVGTNCQSIDIKSGSEKEIYFQNRKVVLGLTLTKLNDAVLGLSAGGQINYKLVIKNTGNQSLSGVTIKDAPAGGFTFVAGSGFLGSDPITPTFSGGYIEWYIGVLAAGEEKTLTYKMQTGSDLVNGVYPNIAIATGIYTPSEYVPEEVVGIFSPIVVEALAVDDNAEEGQRIESNEGTPVNSEVRIASSLSYSTGVGSTGQVLGASTEVGGQVLPAAGSSTWNLALALLSLIFGFGLKALGIAVERGKIDTRRVRRGLKKASLFLSSLALFLVLASTTKAFSDYVYITKLDSYLNKENFYLSYSALSENPISAQFYVRRDGDATWRTVGSLLNGASGQVEVKSGDIYGGDGKYFFKVVINSGTASDETSTTIDRSSPDPVRDYRKEKISDGHYKLHWRNPDNIDFDKVKIYRSENTNFTADSSTEVGTVWGTAGSEMTWENAAAPGKEYYFAIRAIDKAGNASSVVADPETQVVAGAVLGESTKAPETEEVKILPKEKKGEVLGEEKDASKGEATTESTPSPESEKEETGGVLGQAVKFAKEKTKLTLVIALLLGLASYFASKFLRRRG